MSDMIKPDPETSRHNTSENYLSYIKNYEEFHLMGKGMFNGRSLLKFVDIIKGYLERNDCKSILDYGSGKGQLYTDSFREITCDFNSASSFVLRSLSSTNLSRTLPATPMTDSAIPNTIS